MNYKTRSGFSVKWVIWIGIAMIAIVVFHIGGSSFSHSVGQFSPLIGAFIGGVLTLYSASVTMLRDEQVERWSGFEQASWFSIGCAIIAWGLGESVWRYYISVGQTPFPSLADIGYSLFPPLAFLGLLLQPAPSTKSRRLVLLFDSLISMGSIFAIAWYLLLGSLAQAPGEANLAKFLGIYYPTADMALLSCVVFLLLRGQGHTYQAKARRISLLVIGLGFCFFISSDFFFNIQNNAGTYIEATWVDLGWPLGMMTIGVAAYLRRFLPATPNAIIEQRQSQDQEIMTFTPQMFVPYALLFLLFVALILDVLAPDAGQRAIRPVLLFSTLAVIVLLVTRQIFTLWDNLRLNRQQAEALVELETANRQVAQQSHEIAEHNLQLEHGIDHLKTVQASIANGNLRARANLAQGPLLPLAGSLNLMAERLARLGQANTYAQRLIGALSDLSTAIDKSHRGTPFALPNSCRDLTEINRLLVSLHIRTQPQSPQQVPQPSPTTHPLRREVQQRPFPTQVRSAHQQAPYTTNSQQEYAQEERTWNRD